MTFLVRAAGAGLMLGLQIAIAKQVGATGAGFVAVAFTYSGLAAVIGRQGIEQLVMRRVAASGTTADVHHEYASAIRAAAPLLVGGALVLVLGSRALIATGVLPSGNAWPLLWLACGVPALGVLVIQGEAIKGAGSPIAGAAVQSFVGPVVSLVALFVQPNPTPGSSAAAIAIGYWAASGLAHLVWQRTTGPAPVTVSADAESVRAESKPFFAASVFSVLVLNAPIVALSFHHDAAEAARYFAADRWTQIPSMMLVAVNSTVAPVFAREWAAGNREQVRSLLRRSTRLTVPLALGATATLALAAPILLGLFGDEFTEAATVLRIMAVGQLVLLGFGPITAMLTMIGEERFVRTATAVAASISVVGCLAAVPSAGATGAAIAVTGSVVVSRLMILAHTRRVLERPTAAPTTLADSED